MSDQPEPTPREKNFRICAMCCGVEPTNKEFAKWMKYRYTEFMLGEGECQKENPTMDFGLWLEKNAHSPHWKFLPNTGERK